MFQNKGNYPVILIYGSQYIIAGLIKKYMLYLLL